MQNQPEDILENLTFVNGKEAPQVSYSYEDLKDLSSTDLKNLCKKLKVASHKRKPQMIENILNG